MICFFADSHFDKHCGLKLYEQFPAELAARTVFTENQWDILESGEWERDCELLILNMIATTCGQPHAGAGAEAAVKRYVERGGNILMLHGSSAAFWQWQWWREITGVRWVRPNDPDGVERSTHPKAPCHVAVCKCRHPLCRELENFDLPEDEIYIDLEQTSPVSCLMTCDVNGKSYPQCTSSFTPWGGEVINFIPGHKEECVSNAALNADIARAIRYLL